MSGNDDARIAASPLAQTRVILVGNYARDGLLSMDRYTRLLCEGLRDRGMDVIVESPRACLAALPGMTGLLAKLAGFVDKFLLFPLALRWRLWNQRSSGVRLLFHVTDQGNGLYLPWLRGAPRMVTNHDLLAIRASLGEFPEHRRPSVIQGWIRWALKQADTVMSVSSKSRSDAERLLDGRRQRFVMGPNAVDRAFLRDTPMERPSDLPEHYLLHVGSGSWYKNRQAVLRIYAALRSLLSGEAMPSLVLIGERLNELEQRTAIELGLGDGLVFRERPDDNYVIAAYGNARALVFPSIEEGFGWPILEAMGCGCPVFTTNREPMTEVGGDVAIYIDPDKPADAAAMLAHCLRQGDAWRQMKAEQGRAWAATFSTERFIDGVLAAYAATMSGGSMAQG